MTTTPDLLNQLRSEWRRRGRQPDARDGLRDFRERHPDLALDTCGDLADLVDSLDQRGPLSVLQRVAVIACLLEDATDPLLRRTLLQALLPGVIGVCRELRFGDGIIEQPSDCVGQAISMLTELLVDWAGQRRPFAAPDLLSALRGRLRRWLMKEKALRDHASVEGLADMSSSESSPLMTRLAYHRQGPHARLARLTYERVVNERPWKELADADHSSTSSLQSELRSFALRFLV